MAKIINKLSHRIGFVGLFGLLWISTGFSHGELVEPPGLAMPLPAQTVSYVYDPNRDLDLDALNGDFPVGKGDRYQRGSDLYQGKMDISLQRILSLGMAYYEGQGKTEHYSALRYLRSRLPGLIKQRFPSHQFNLGNLIGNHIVFYGSDSDSGKGPDHRDIDRLVHSLGVPQVKIMTHFDESQGGTLSKLLANGVGGMTHAGGFQPGWHGGKPISVHSEWPADYGSLDNDNVDYNAHLLAVDYQAGTRQVIPHRVLENYHRNYSLWDAISGLMVPFAKKSQFKDFRDYTNNPLEMVDANSMREIAESIATLDSKQVRFTNYCSEGQWNNANMAVNILIQKGRFPAIDRLISAYQGAPGYSDMGVGERYIFPEIGWKWLKAQGVLSEKQYKVLVQTKRDAIYLDWIDDDIEPWTVYQPARRDGLIATPMTLGTLVRGLIRIYYPRGHVADVVKEALISRYREGTVEDRKALETLLNGISPESEEGDRKLEELSTLLVGIELTAVLGSEQVQSMLLDKLGFQHVIESKDKQRIKALYQRYLASITDTRYLARGKLDAYLDQLDQELESLTVKMHVYGPNDRRKRTQVGNARFFMWAAPQSWVFWAKYPNLFRSSTIRYVATAMHYEQSKEFALDNGN